MTGGKDLNTEHFLLAPALGFQSPASCSVYIIFIVCAGRYIFEEYQVDN